MKKNIKRVLSLLLVAILIVGSLPAISYAETEPLFRYGNSHTNGTVVKTILDSTVDYANTELMYVRQNGSQNNKFTAYCIDWTQSLRTNVNYLDSTCNLLI